MWNQINDYVPPFNSYLFPYNFDINFSYESIWIFKPENQNVKNLGCFFLHKNLVDKWNEKSLEKVDFIFITFHFNGEFGEAKVYKNVY